MKNEEHSNIMIHHRERNTVFLPERLGAITGTMSAGRTSPDSTMGLLIF